MHEAADLLRTYEGKVWQQVLPEGGEFPELLKFRPQKEYVREILKSVRLTAVEEGWEELEKVPDSFRFFSYNARINGNVETHGTHVCVDKLIKERGEDFRIQNKEHPVKALQNREEDNINLARIK